ncbi:MAG TPA: hypothetical protein VJ696_07790 [Rhodanobacteraceae bacterium]|nr:hypothetical protein [Rhodanobacteraceae bacterium]
MNRGDFGHVYLPKTFHVVSPGKYLVANGVTAFGGPSGTALGTFAGAAPAALRFAIPQDVLDDLRMDGLVDATSVDLYDEARNPTASSANLTRYFSLLRRIAAVAVDDGP